MALRTPELERIENEWSVEQEKKAASIKLDTSREGVEGWKLKNFKVWSERERNHSCSVGSGFDAPEQAPSQRLPMFAISIS